MFLISGINKVAPTKLSIFDTSDPFWEDVADDLMQSQWQPGKLVILTKFIHSLHPVNIPHYFQTDQLSTLDWSVLSSNESEEGTQLMQWSDMIIFDFLTANLDRVVNNLHNLQWNSRMLQYPVHNLQQRSSDALFLLFDNESGLLHSYRYLDKYNYSKYHDQLLSSVCLFSPLTISIIHTVASHNDTLPQSPRDAPVWTKMYSDFTQQDPLHPKLPKMPSRFVATLQNRVDKVTKHVNYCNSRQSSPVLF